MSDPFGRYTAALKLSSSAETIGNIQRAAATAYVWGWQDARGGDKNTDEASTFGYRYGEMAALYAAGKLPRKDNIASAFERWQETGDVLTPDQHEHLYRQGWR